MYCLVLYYNLLHSTALYYISTRSSGRSAPLLLAPAESFGALRAPRALKALLGAFGPSSVEEGSKQNILNLVSK